MTDQNRVPAAASTAGEMTSVFRADFGPTPDEWLPASGQGPPPGNPVLVVKRGPRAGAQIVLDKAVTSVGRHPDSDLFLDDISVSRRHAEVRVTQDNDVDVVDTGSLNGTYVNRAPVDFARLVDGDEVQIGKFRLLFVAAGPHAIA